MKQERYAFWEYDHFPFVLSAKVAERRNGFVIVEGYGGMSVTPLKIIGGKTGAELSKQLERLREEYRQAQRSISEAYCARALAVAPFLKDCKRTSAYSPASTQDTGSGKRR